MSRGHKFLWRNGTGPYLGSSFSDFVAIRTNEQMADDLWLKQARSPPLHLDVAARADRGLDLVKCSLKPINHANFLFLAFESIL